VAFDPCTPAHMCFVPRICCPGNSNYASKGGLVVGEEARTRKIQGEMR